MKTIEEAFNDLREAWIKFFLTCIETFRINQFVDWLNKKLQ